MAASHRAAAVLLAVMSLLVAVALFGADARPAVRSDKTAAGAGASSLTVRSDEHGPGYVAVAGDAGPAVAKPECDHEDEDDDEDEEPDHHSHPDHPDHPHHPDHPGHLSGSGDRVEQDPEHDGWEHTGDETDHGGSDDSAELPHPQSRDPGMAGTEFFESEVDQEELDHLVQQCNDCKESQPPDDDCFFVCLPVDG